MQLPSWLCLSNAGINSRLANSCSTFCNRCTASGNDRSHDLRMCLFRLQRQGELVHKHNISNSASTGFCTHTNEPVQADCTRPSLGCRRIFFLDTSTGSQVPLVGKLAKFRILCVQMLECRLQAGVCLQPLQVFVHVQAHVVLVNQDRHLGGPASSASALGPGLVPVHLARGEGWRV